jgi:hypothetical protein
MSHPKQHIKTILQFILPSFIMLFGINYLMATECTDRAELAEVPSYLLEEMEANSSTVELFEDKKKKGDAFAKKDKKKKPNIYSSKPPRTKSRSKLYMHAMSKKKVKKTNQPVFSSTKPRYNLFKDQKKANKKSKRENKTVAKVSK